MGDIKLPTHIDELTHQLVELGVTGYTWDDSLADCGCLGLRVD